MTERLSYLIIGNGIAGATAAEILRTEDTAADVTVIADDPFPVYYRPALKDYLGGKLREDKLWTRPISFYQDRSIRFLTDRVMSVDPKAHLVHLRSGQQVPYSRLLLAHGANASTLTCPGVNLIGVTTLRTVADYQKVLSRLGVVRNVVIVGSGTLALETVETLRHRNIGVTHLLRRRALWSDVLDPVASDLVLQQEKRNGVSVLVEQEIAEVLGCNGQVIGVRTTVGVQISCEMVLLGIGIEPLIDLPKRAGIACGKGVKVDGTMHTNQPDIYAAGDIIETTDPTTTRTRVIGQWYPAIQQGRAAAYAMLDLLDVKHEFHFGNFYNASMLYGLEFASVGISSIPKNSQGYQEITADPQPRMYQKVILKNGVPVGMLALGDRRAVLAFKRAIDYGVNLTPVASRLFSPDFKLHSWLDSQGVPGPILGVSRDGAVSVKQVAYEDAGSRSAILKPQTITEAVLLPLGPPEVKSTLGEIYLSQTKVLAVGRQPGMGLTIEHVSISRRHAEISYANGQYVLRDLESRNGTTVNATNITPGSVYILKSEDTITFGKVSFILKIREVSGANSQLFRKSVNLKPALKTIAALEQVSSSEPDAAKTVLVNLEAQKRAATAFSFPQMRPDGSLMVPNASYPLPPIVAASLKENPALVVLIQGKPEAFPLKKGKRFVIGRDRECDIVLADASISRKHAEVLPGPRSLYIRDMGSSNGVFVNQIKIDNPYGLSHGDCIDLGNIILYFLGVSQREILPSLPSFHKEAQPFLPSEAGRTKKADATQAKSCRSCGALNSSLAHFCAGCGTPL